MRKEIVPVLLVLFFSSVLATSFVVVRWLYSGRLVFYSLIWDLFLAWLPLLMALIAVALRRTPVLLWVAGAVWLLFYPNAPYLLTEFVHLGRWNDAPFWYDLMLLLVFALTGLLLGFVSLEIMHQLVYDAWGRVAGWFFVVSTLSLSSVGVYIGRFLRWNSWDLLTRPSEVLSDLLTLLLQPWAHRQAYAFSIALATLLICAYVVIHRRPRSLQRVYR